MPKARDLPAQDELLELLSYDPETGLLRWRYRPTGTPQWNAKHTGKIAGNISKSNGRIVLNIGKRLYLAHRIIWKMVYGEDAPELDHEDTDGTNNRLNNLRPATHHQNMHNQSRHAGKVLPKGVTARQRSGRFRADIYLDGRQKFLGEFDSPDLAHAAYCQAARVRGEFARFD
jgi:hypothetical protein